MTSRDLTFNLVSNLRSFNLDAGARELDRLGDAARDIDFDHLAREARDAARDIDRSFSTISRSASRGLDTGVGQSLGGFRRRLKDAKQEAAQTSREMFASFSGSGSVADAAQELSANVGTFFGPIGGIIGGLLSAGIFTFLDNARAAKETMSDLTNELISSQGKISAAFVDSQIQRAAAEDAEAFVALKQRVQEAGVSWTDYARAKYGDLDAAERLNAGLDELTGAIERQQDTADPAELRKLSDAAEDYARVISDLTPSVEAAKAAQEAYGAVNAATVSDLGRLDAAAANTRTEWDLLSASTGKPIRARVELDMPSSVDFERARRGLMAGMGTIVVPVQPGQSRNANTTNNSRYRE